MSRGKSDIFSAIIIFIFILFLFFNPVCGGGGGDSGCE